MGDDFPNTKKRLTTSMMVAARANDWEALETNPLIKLLCCAARIKFAVP